MWIHQIIKRRRKRKRKRRIKHYTSITGTAGIQKICLTAYWNMPMMKPMSIASGIVRRPVVSCGLINRFFVLWCPCLLLYSPHWQWSSHSTSHFSTRRLCLTKPTEMTCPGDSATLGCERLSSSSPFPLSQSQVSRLL